MRMIRWWPAALLTVAATMGTIVALPGAASAGTVLFKDYFSSSPDPAWTFYNRFGVISRGALRINGGYQPGAVGRGGWAATHVGADWENYKFTATYNSSNPSGLPSPDVHMASFLVRVENATPEHQTYYRVDIWDKGAGDPTGPGYCAGRNGAPLPHGMVLLSKYVNGQALFNVFNCDSNSVIGANKASVTVNGPSISVTVNDKRIIALNDGDPLPSGGVGFLAIWEETASFDNAVVTSVP